MTTDKEARRKIATDKLLTAERGQEREFDRLHAIICLPHVLDNADALAFNELIDGVRIAERLDELLAALRAKVRA